MNGFASAIWAETLKARRSRLVWLTLLAFLMLPVVDTLFMLILKDPEQARSWGLIGVKAQLAAGVADWPTFLQVLLLGTAIAGGILFSFVTAWVFGREFADRTAKEWLALPVVRETMVAAKFVLIAMWVVGLSLPVMGAAVILGWATDIPGWSPEALMSACVAYAGIRHPQPDAHALRSAARQRRARLPRSVGLGVLDTGARTDCDRSRLGSVVPLGRAGHAGGPCRSSRGRCVAAQRGHRRAGVCRGARRHLRLVA